MRFIWHHLHDQLDRQSQTAYRKLGGTDADEVPPLFARRYVCIAGIVTALTIKARIR